MEQLEEDVTGTLRNTSTPEDCLRRCPKHEFLLHYNASRRRALSGCAHLQAQGSASPISYQHRKRKVLLGGAHWFVEAFAGVRTLAGTGLC